MTAPTYTLDDCLRVAEKLRGDAKLTLLAACIDVGLTSKQYTAIKTAMHRVRKGGEGQGHAASEEMVERILPILRAVDQQCEKLLDTAELLAGEGKSANLYTWLLEKKNRHEYGNITRTEHTGEDGEAIKVNGMAGKTDEELIELMLKATKTQGGSE